MGQGLPNRAVAVSGRGPVRLRNVRRHAPSPRAAGPRAGSRRLPRRPPRAGPCAGAPAPSPAGTARWPACRRWAEIRRQGLAGGVPAALVRKPQALEGGFRGGGPFRRGRHATEGDTRIDDAAPLHGEPEGAQEGGDVLIEALGDLVAAEDLVGLEARHVDTGHELARRQVLLAVVDEEVLEWHRPRRLAPAQVQCRTERDQSGRRIADREPLAMLPPSVPTARTCLAPKRRNNSTRSGSIAAMALSARA